MNIMMQKKISSLFLCMSILVAVSIKTSAHSGGTDSSGGHMDHSNGTYHYHHGYPAHHHYDMDDDGFIDCPYLFDYSSDLDTETGAVTESSTEPTEEISIDWSALESAIESLEEYNASMESLPQYLTVTTSPTLYSSSPPVTGSDNQTASSDSSSSSNGFIIFLGIIGVAFAVYILHRNKNR